MKLKSLLKSKLVLYTTFVVAILHVLGYIAVDDDKALLFFIALGVLTTFFSKNMIIVLGIALFLKTSHEKLIFSSRNKTSKS